MAHHFTRSLRHGLLALLTLLLLASCAGPTLLISPRNPQSLTLRGLDSKTLSDFTSLPPENQQAAFQVRVADAPPTAPSIAGAFTRQDHDLLFQPRYPFQPCVQYRVLLDPATFHNPPHPTEFMIPAPSTKPITHITAIYPTADQLPENLLKFYIQFSGPMSRGEAYSHIHLLDASGKPVPWPFLELPEELWNPEMTRFTLFFDPGRIKQGLVPRLEAGPALLAGKTYSLTVDADWQDSQHRPLTAPTTKTFRALPADARQPDPNSWRITPPTAGTLQPLTITFEKPLDYALLLRVLTLRDTTHQIIPGKITLADHEQRWSFTPENPWTPGRHLLLVDTILEDNAGNSLGRPFEVNLNLTPTTTAPATLEIPFQIKPRP